MKKYTLKDHQLRAIGWAVHLAAYPLCVIDTETTGLDGSDEVFQVSAVHIDNGAVGATFNTYVKPKRALSPDAQRITGIYPKDLIDKPAFVDIAPDLRTFANGRIMLAFNAAFDNRLLEQTRIIHKVPPLFNRRFECLMLACAEFIGEWDEYHGNFKWPKLDRACKLFGVDNTTAHNSLSDTIASAQVFIQLSKAEEHRLWKI